MPARSPSVDRICSVAVQHFAQRGYDAASLNDIATDVGIRKASLYTHFDSKDALFLEVFQDALAIETEFARAAFAAETRRAQPGSRYCAALRERLDASPYLRFLLRAAYLPPAALRDHVQAGYEGYVEGLRAAFQAQLRERYPELSGRDVTQFGEAWLGIVDSLHVELIYAEGRQFAARLKAMQRLLADSLAAA